jgi:O-succinylbenzoate synthase
MMGSERLHMGFKIFHFKIFQEIYGVKEGFLLQNESNWSEVSPLPGRNRESLDQVLEQLKAVQAGYLGPLYPSVEFGLFGLTASKILSAPVCLFLNGTVQDILMQAKKNHGCQIAKVKLGSFDLATALFLVKVLKQDFRLRLDIGGKWDKEKTMAFLSHFAPDDFEFIEDPGHDISPFLWLQMINL